MQVTAKINRERIHGGKCVRYVYTTLLILGPKGGYVEEEFSNEVPKVVDQWILVSGQNPTVYQFSSVLDPERSVDVEGCALRGILSLLTFLSEKGINYTHVQVVSELGRESISHRALEEYTSTFAFMQLLSF